MHQYIYKSMFLNITSYGLKAYCYRSCCCFI